MNFLRSHINWAGEEHTHIASIMQMFENLLERFWVVWIEKFIGS